MKPYSSGETWFKTRSKVSFSKLGLIGNCLLSFNDWYIRIIGMVITPNTRKIHAGIANYRKDKNETIPLPKKKFKTVHIQNLVGKLALPIYNEKTRSCILALFERITATKCSQLMWTSNRKHKKRNIYRSTKWWLFNAP